MHFEFHYLLGYEFVLRTIALMDVKNTIPEPLMARNLFTCLQDMHTPKNNLPLPYKINYEPK
jgi:hypothetical protein